MNFAPLTRFSMVRGAVHLLVKVQNRFVISLVLRGFRSFEKEKDLVRLGTFYGGWWIPRSYLDAKAEELKVISVGLGHDVSFDKEIVSAGFQAVGIDPLKHCVDLARKEIQNLDLFKLINEGLWIEDGTQTFFAPRVKGSDAWSATNSQENIDAEIISFPVVTLDTLFTKLPEFKKSKYLYLKMDIEGAERRILEETNLARFPITFLGIEMDFLSLIPLLAFKKRIKMVKSARSIMQKLNLEGFTFVYNENFNFFWKKA